MNTCGRPQRYSEAHCENGDVRCWDGNEMETKVVGDGDVCMRGRLGMDIELAGTDGDGDECTSTCSSLQ